MKHASESLIRSAYRSQPDMRDRATSLLKAGCVGLMIMDGSACVSRAWMCTPASNGPQHLPRAVKSSAAYWIFYCATDPNYRRRGLYKFCLQELVRHARRQRPDSEVFIDTTSANSPSRRAITSVGFEPNGVIASYRFPKTHVVFGRWNNTKAHPTCEHEPVASHSTVMSS